MEAPMEPWEQRLHAGGKNGPQEASVVLWEPRWGQEAKMEPWRPHG